MISPAQIRAARGLLRWTQATLAHRAAISTVTLNMIENEAVRPRGHTLSAIQAALQAAGIELLGEDGSGIGVRFHRFEPPVVEATKPTQNEVKIGVRRA